MGKQPSMMTMTLKQLRSLACWGQTNLLQLSEFIEAKIIIEIALGLLVCVKPILTSSGYPPTGKVLGALICFLNVPYGFAYQVYLTYALGCVRARHVQDHAFEIGLLT